MKHAPRTGFAVVYQWRVKQGMHEQFFAAWEELTEQMMRKRGARGSRLHRTDQGTLVAYAQWPDQATWEKSCALHNMDEELSRRILDAVEETWSPMFLTTLSDQLLPESEGADSRHDHTH